MQEKWLFACSLEKNCKKKVRKDLAAAKDFGEQVDQLDFFHHLPVKTADRHKLAKEAQEKCGLKLEIFDGPAIAEMLADPQTLWIAERYLSLPSEFILPREVASPEWFEAVLHRTYDQRNLRSADFFELKEAVRFATWRPEHHTDLDKLLEDTQLFRNHPFPGIQRKAIYETFVASLRGLETTTGLEPQLREYFAEVESLNEPSEVEDGAVLVGYALGAKARGVLDIPLTELRSWHDRLSTRIATLRSESETAGRQCSCLFVEGYLAFNKFLTIAHETETAGLAELRGGGKAAIAIWHRLLKKAPNAPMFPIERLTRLLSELVVPLDNVTGLDQLIRELDKLSAKRSGRERIAENHRERAKSYRKAEHHLRALEELHSAHSESFFSGASLDAVIACIQLSKLYAQLHLYFAAKYYGLAAAYAALRLPDEQLRKFAYVGCAEAASADYASGASLLYFLAAHLFVMLTHEYSMGGSEDLKKEEWARINFYALVLARGAGLVLEKLQHVIISQFLPVLGLDEVYAESNDELDQFFSKIQNSDALAAMATSEGVAPPFSDTGGKRTVAWHQLSTNWHLEWETNYDTERQAEALAGYLQILLADFATIELSMIPGDVFVCIAVHDGKLEIREEPDNDRVSRVVLLPRFTTETRDSLPSAAEVVAIVLLSTASALPMEEFRNRCEARFAAGLRNRLSVYRSAETLFEEFYSREAYAQLYNVGRSGFIHMPEYVIRTRKELDGPQGTHPMYDREKFLTLIRNRYKNVEPLIRFTLPRLIRDGKFQSVMHELRAEGWKDWHLLMAIEGIRFNYLLNNNRELSRTFDKGNKKSLMEFRGRPEEENSPEVPLTYFTAEALRQSLTLTQMSTLKGLGLDVKQSTPNLKGIGHLLRRFHYWDDDVDHIDPFRVGAPS